MNKKEFKTGLIIVMILFISMLVVSGGTFAYFQWRSSAEQATALNVSVTDNINMYIDPPSITKYGMRPTNNCAGDFAMSGVSTVTIDNDTGTLARPRLKLKLKITDKDGNNITNETSPAGQKYMYYIKYAVTEENGVCTNSLAEGRFNLTTETSLGSGWYDSATLTGDDEDGFPDIFTSVSFNAAANAVTSHKYKVTVWIDENYTTVNTGNTVTNDKLQNATITVSWSENSTVEQVRLIPPGEAYAVYSADDTSLRFYRSTTLIEEGSTYNGKTVTAVYTGFEDNNYEYEPFSNGGPWSSYAQNITSVIFEDEIIAPRSLGNWFAYFSNCAYFDMIKLNTSYVTDMFGMFQYAGSDTTTFSIIGINNWDTSNVRNMGYMFYNTGKSANYTLDLSGWNVCNIAIHNEFNTDVTDKITSPNWDMECPTT